MDNLPACQSQLPGLNLGGYKDQHIQIEQLKILIYLHLHYRLCRYKYTSNEEVASLILRAHITAR